MSRWDGAFKPHVGQKVKLNRVGFAELKLESEEAFEQAKNMTIIGVENLGDAYEPIWSIDVNQPLINQFMLDTSMVQPL